MGVGISDILDDSLDRPCTSSNQRKAQKTECETEFLQWPALRVPDIVKLVAEVFICDE
jgi:hypothetical protein